MKGFVAAWFFPPQTSAEGLVTFKLLKYSRHQYDVCSSASDLWSYHTESQLACDNISVFPIQAESLEDWTDKAFDLFEQRNKTEKYDFVMTRSMPPESLLFGFKVKEKYPDMKWIASFADPIARNPYELAAYVEEDDRLSPTEKIEILRDLKNNHLLHWKQSRLPSIQLLCKLSEWEKKALDLADHYIFPSVEQKNYTLQDTLSPKAWVIPHSYDAEVIPTDIRKPDSERVTITYCGFTDKRRSLQPLVQAVRKLKLKNNPNFEKLQIRVIGNTPREIKDMVFDYHVQDTILFERSVDYITSLRIMGESDWLLHVEAYFEDLEGGSIFFASKLADYFALKKPILALCSPESAAGKKLVKAGAEVIPVSEQEQLVNFLEKLINGEAKPCVNEDYCKLYDAKTVAGEYDRLLEKGTTVEDYIDSHSRKWPAREAKDTKLISICIPSYNAERYLDRCLLSLVRAEEAGYLDIIVVNDGSKDHTQEIAEIYTSRYPGIVRCIHKANGGHGSTINAALGTALGKYYMVLDSDDWVNTDALDQLIQKIHADALDEDLILTHYYKVDLESGEYRDSLMQNGIPFDTPFTFESVDVEGMYIALANSLMKTSMLQKAGLKLQEKTFYVDVEYILLPIPYIQTMRYLDFSLYRYCVGNANQSIDLQNMVMRYDHHERVMKRVIQYYAAAELSESKKKYMRNILEQLLITHYNLCLHDDHQTKRGLERAREFDRFLAETANDLYKAAGKKVIGLRRARATNYKISGSIREQVKTNLGQFSRSSFGKKLIYNPVTHAITHSRIVKIKPIERAVLFLVSNKEEKK